MLAEQVTRAFWPLWSLGILLLGALALGLHERLSVEAVWAAVVVSGLALVGLLVWGARRFRWPSRDAARVRLDATLPGRPIQTLLDVQAVGRGDAASEAVWAAHQARMAARVAGARAVEPDLRISRADPFGLRYVALLVLLVGLLFGSFWRVGTLAETAAGGTDLANGPTWEGWLQPPGYTGLPTAYLADLNEDFLLVPEGSQLTLRLYGEIGALTLSETVSMRTGDVPSAAEPTQEFWIRQSGQLSINGPGGQSWEVIMLEDIAPEITATAPAESSARGEMTLPFEARDDYAVTGGKAVIALDLKTVDRRYGLATEPEAKEPIEVELPMPIAGDRSEFEDVLIEDFSAHVWAHLPVTVSLSATDAAGQTGRAKPEIMALPARRFFDPLAAAVIEQRRDLLWSRQNAARIARMLRVMSHRPESLFSRETHYLRLRTILRRLEATLGRGMSDAKRQELADALWDLAIMLEEGDLSDALERMRRAQDRLAEAMKNGASDEEIAQLMQELRDATQDYMQRLAQQQQQPGQDGEQQRSENTMTLSQDDLQRMMDRIQELMEQGRMAEAQQALEEFQQMMENMQVTQGQNQGEPSPGQQAMDDLADTMKQQQGLSDQAFRDLQEQFNPNARSGQSAENEGLSGGEGRGKSHDGTGGQGGEGGDNQQAEGQGTEGALADRQQALRNELDRQQRNMPGRGTPEGDAAREALGRAGDAMEGAEDALRNDDLAEAIDKQAEAMEAMRDGLRNLGEAMAQEQRNSGQQGTEQGRMSDQSRDPLGRNPGSGNPQGSEDGMLQGEDVYRRARDLLEEIRRRSGEGARPEVERNYLRRLLDRF